MSFMFEFYYKSPEDKAKEADIVAEVLAAGGRLDYHELPEKEGGPIILTFEFVRRDQAEVIFDAFRQRGEHVEGISDYS
jgi:hypothetical protein